MSSLDEPVKFKEGQVIFAEGEMSSYLYIVLTGEVFILKEINKKLQLLTLVGEEDFIGELSMFSDAPRSATAIAGTYCELIMVKKTEIQQIMKLCPDWITHLMVTMGDRLKNTVNMLREHRILDDISQDNLLTPEDLKNYHDNLLEYKKRRGIA